MARDAALEFTRSLVDRFMQIKSMLFQRELLERREDRYAQQLQENRLHRQRQQEISEAHLKLRERYTTAVEQEKLAPKVSVFTTGQIEDVEQGLARMFLQSKGEDGKVSREKALQLYDIANRKYAGQIKDPNQFDAIYDTTADRMSGIGVDVDWDPQDPTVRAKRPYFQGQDSSQQPLFGPEEKPEKGTFGRIGDLWKKWTPQGQLYEAGKKVFQGTQKTELLEPKTREEFTNTLRRLQLEDYQKAKEYYEKYLDRFSWQGPQ